MYKLLALDIDGTLLNSRDKITDKTKEYIKKASSKGVKVIICSGRTLYGILDVAKELELEKIGGYILALNGGTFFDYENNKLIYELPLSKEEVIDIYNYSKEKDLPMFTFNNDVLTTPSEVLANMEYIRKRNKNKIDLRVNFIERLDFNVPKIVFYGDKEVLEKMEKEAQERFSNISVFRSEPHLLEFCSKDVHKGKGIEKLIKILGIKKEEVIAVGDGYNDLTMIEFAGLGVAMGNSGQSLKDIADYVTKSNDDDGICDVIEKFILNK